MIMGNLTTDMTHLCREINALRNGRKAFRKNLENTVLRMRKDFSADLAGAHQAWFGPTLAGKMDIKREQQRKGEPGASQEKAEAGAGRKEEIQRAAVREEKWSFPTLKAGSKGKRKK
jgi:hypothetical protein